MVAVLAWTLGGCSPSHADPPSSDAAPVGDGAPSDAVADADAKTADAADADLGVDARDDGAADGSETSTASDAEAGDALDSGPGDSFVDAAAETPPPEVPQCTLSAAIGTQRSLAPASTADDDILGGVTPDGLTVAWLSVQSKLLSTVYVAERASTTLPFGAPVAVAAPVEGFALSRVGLSPDGLRLIFTPSDHGALRQLVRPARGTAFGATSDGAPFASIAPFAIETGSTAIADPVVAANDLVLYYSCANDTVSSSVCRSVRATPADAWSAGVAMSDAAFGRAATNIVRPTGLSADRLTLFLFSEVTGGESAVFFAHAEASVTVVVDLGARAYASPSTDCTTLYYSAPSASGTAGLDLVSEP